MKGKGSIYDARSELAKRVGVESTSSSNSNQSYSNQQSTTQTDDWEEKLDSHTIINMVDILKILNPNQN